MRTKSIHISDVDVKSCKMQKKPSFDIFWPKNTYISGCKIVHKCTNATIIMHIWTIIVALAFNILVIFSLSLSLVAFTLTSLSVFLIWSTHQTTTIDQLIRPAQSLIKSPITIATKPLRSLLATDFLLFDQWVSGWVGDDLAFELNEFQIEWVLDWVGFWLNRFWIEWVSNWVGFGLNGLVFLNDASWVGDDGG